MRVTSIDTNLATTMHEGGVITVAFGSDTDPSHYLIFQQTDKPDAQDEALGLTGLYFEFGNQGCGGYGCVTSITASKRQLSVEVDSEVLGLSKERTPLKINHTAGEDSFRDAIGLLQRLAVQNSIPFLIIHENH